MISLAQFLKGHALFSDVYSQYGPAYYLGGWLFYKGLGLSVSNDITRILNIAGWLITAVISSFIALRISRSFLAALLTHILVFRGMFSVANEPGHPQVFCIVLLVSAVFMVTFHTGDPRRIWPLFFAGLFGGLLAATKINLGVYYALAGLLLLAFSADLPRIALVATFRGIVACGSLFLVVALIRPLFFQQEYVLFCVSMVAGLVGIILAARRYPSVPVSSQQAIWAIGGFLLGVVVPCLFVLAGGTTIKDLLYGMIFQHVGFEKIFSIPMPTTLWNTALSSIIAGVLAIWLFSREKTSNVSLFVKMEPSLARPVAFLKLVLGLLYVAVLPAVTRNLDNLYFSLPFLWLILLPPIGLEQTAEVRLGRAFLCFAGIMEVLWVYPAAGGQVALASVLPTVAIALCISEGVRGSRITHPAAPNWLSLAAQVLCGVLFLVWGYGLKFRELSADYRAQQPLDLPGAHWLVRAPAAQYQEIHEVVRYLRENSDTFIMAPGMNSFYFWTQKEPPTSLNAGTWMTLLNDQQQQRIIDTVEQLRQKERVLVLRHAGQIKGWTRHLDVSQKPLMLYITNNFRTVKQVGEYEILEPR